MTPGSTPASGTRDLATARAQRAQDADVRLRELFATTGLAEDPESARVALVAVGGYGRSELSPFSDLDVVLLHAPEVPDGVVEQVARAVWYPLWEDKVSLDHSVRDADQMAQAALDDDRVAMGMLDARAVAGDAGLVLELRSRVLTSWRRDARARVGRVRERRDERVERAGWLAHSAVPDLKESGGGLRDGVVLRALQATWLVDVPQVEAERLRHGLLDVRDALHEVAGRRVERLDPDVIPAVAERLDLPPVELDLLVRDLGRRVAHQQMLAWRRVDDALVPRRKTFTTAGPVVRALDDGVGVLDGEVIVVRKADPAADPEVALRAAAAAAREKLPLSAGTAVRLAATMGDLPEPWEPSSQRLMIDLLSSGAGLVPVWDELDFAGVVDRWLPEWAAIRLRGSSSPVHQFTVDRHSLETCVNAAGLAREVDRPDLLVVAALLHDIGKGVEGDHSEQGEPMARAIALRWGFDEADADVIAFLVRRHLVLPDAATRRDIEDPATATGVADLVGSAERLELLAALTSSDARATAPQAWSSWRRGLIEGLVEKTERVFDDAVETPEPADYEGWPMHVPIPKVGATGPADVDLTVEQQHAGSRLTIVTSSRAGVMAELAGGLALAGLAVRSARTVSLGDAAVSLWEVSRPDVDAAALRDRLRPALAGDLDLAGRLDVSQRADDVDPRVRLVDSTSRTASVFSVRAQDRRGLVWAVCRTIVDAGHTIRSAHVSTYGQEARDVFYVIDAHGDRLAPEAAETLRLAILAALS